MNILIGFIFDEMRLLVNRSLGINNSVLAIDDIQWDMITTPIILLCKTAMILNQWIFHVGFMQVPLAFPK
jgi:hypothetical protein